MGSANEFTVNANKKTIMPADVFAALDEIDMGFMKEQLEAEFNSTSQPSQRRLKLSRCTLSPSRV